MTPRKKIIAHYSLPQAREKLSSPYIYSVNMAGVLHTRCAQRDFRSLSFGACVYTISVVCVYIYMYRSREDSPRQLMNFSSASLMCARDVYMQSKARAIVVYHQHVFFLSSGKSHLVAYKKPIFYIRTTLIRIQNISNDFLRMYIYAAFFL